MKDMYADLEKIEARGKRKKEKRKGFFSRGKDDDEPEPVVQAAPEPEPVQEVQPVIEAPAESTPLIEEPVAEPQPVVAPVAEPEPITEPVELDDPANMLQFSESTEEDDSPGQLPPGADPFGAPEPDPAGFSAMPVVQDDDEEESEELPEEPGEVISLDEEIPQAAPIAEPVPVIEPTPAHVTSVPEPMPVAEPAVQTPDPEPAPAPAYVSPEPEPIAQPAPIAEPVVEPTPVPIVQPAPIDEPVVETPAPVAAPSQPAPEPAKPKWVPLSGSELARAEAHIKEYKYWLNKGYKSGKFTKEQCQEKLRHKEVEIGLRAPK